MAQESGSKAGRGAKPGSTSIGEVLTWAAGLPPDGHAARLAARARGAAARIPAEHREAVQRYRLRVVDDDVDAEDLYAHEDSHYTDPAEAVRHVRHVRERYPGEYAVGIYEIEPVFRLGGDSGPEWTVASGGPLNDAETRWAVGYVEDYQDPSGYWCGTTVAVTDYTNRVSAETLLASVRRSDPDFDGYFLLPDRNDPTDDAYEEPPDETTDDSDPCDDGTIGYDYFGSAWPKRDL